MSNALAKTFEVLATTGNEAAAEVLIAALDSPRPRIQDEALRAILERRSPAGCREILRRLHTAPAPWRTILAEYQGRMTGVLRDAALSTDLQACENACQAILWCGEYDLIPPLVTAAEDATSPNAELAAQTVLSLADALYHELATPLDYSRRREPKLFRFHAVAGLEPTLERFTQHGRTELLEACLLLVNRDNVTLQHILHNPKSRSHAAITDLLRRGTHPGILRLVLSFLDEHNAPSAAIDVLAQRSDLKFLRHLLRKTAADLPRAALQNLKRVHELALLDAGLPLFEQFDGEQQAGAVRLMMASGVERERVQEAIRYLVKNGKAEGRRAAVKALLDSPGDAANQAIAAAVDDEDPQVQAAVLKQLRTRQIPNAMRTLLMNIDSQHDVVRDAVRDGLKEFNIERYLSAFDMMELDARQITGELVRRLDPTTVGRLRQELECPSRTRRLRAIEVALSLRLIPELQQELIQLTTCDDHTLRAEATAAISAAPTTDVMDALKRAINDTSFSVQEAAQDSLREIAQRLAEPATRGGNDR